MRLIYQRVTVPSTCPPALRGEGGGQRTSLAGPQRETSRLPSHLVPNRHGGTGSGKRHCVLTCSGTAIHAEVPTQKLLHPQPSARLPSLLPSTQDSLTLSLVIVQWCGRGTTSPHSGCTVPHTLCPASFLRPPVGICSFLFLPVFPRQPDPVSVPHITFITKFS